MANIELQARDIEIINTIKEFKAIRANELASLYFEGKNALLLCQRRLTKLTENKKQLRRWRASILEPYYYYWGSKPKQLVHMAKVAEVYAHLKKHYDILKYTVEKEFKFGNGKSLRADLMVILRTEANDIKVLLVEVNRSHIYSYKWDSFILDGYYKQFMPSEPIILDVSKFASYKTNTKNVIHVRENEINSIVIE